jgi:hypothetical protein
MDMDKKTFMAMGILVATMAQAGAQTCPFEGLCEKSLGITFSEGTLRSSNGGESVALGGTMTATVHFSSSGVAEWKYNSQGMSGEFPNEGQVNCGVTLLVTRDPPCTGKGCTPAVDSRLTLVKTNSCLAQVKDGVVTLKRNMEVVASIDNVSIGNKVTTEYELTANVKNVSACAVDERIEIKGDTTSNLHTTSCSLSTQ